ncbi:MAG: hypothetical protein HY929_03670 [Euryarchaeota archaeon]|nr:hypothetical protein [Euryarchaeota archaeon]
MKLFKFIPLLLMTIGIIIFYVFEFILEYPFSLSFLFLFVFLAIFLLSILDKSLTSGMFWSFIILSFFFLLLVPYDISNHFGYLTLSKFFEVSSYTVFSICLYVLTNEMIRWYSTKKHFYKLLYVFLIYAITLFLLLLFFGDIFPEIFGGGRTVGIFVILLGVFWFRMYFTYEKPHTKYACISFGIFFCSGGIFIALGILLPAIVLLSLLMLCAIFLALTLFFTWKAYKS